MIQRQLDLPLYNINKGIPWIAQKWPESQQYLLTGNIYLMGEVPLEAHQVGRYHLSQNQLRNENLRKKRIKYTRIVKKRKKKMTTSTLKKQAMQQEKQAEQ